MSICPPVTCLLLYVCLPSFSSSSFVLPVFFIYPSCLQSCQCNLLHPTVQFFNPNMYRNHLALPSEAESHFRAVYPTLLDNSLTLICTGTTWPYPARLSPISGLFAGPWFPRLWNSVPSWKRYEYLPTAFFFIFGAVILLTQRSVPKMARILA